MSACLHTGLTIGGVLAASARRNPDKIAVVDGSARITYGELDALADRIASALIALGARRGVNVALLSRNSLAFVAVHFGVARSGATLVPVNFLLAPPELEYVLAHCGASILFFSPEFAPAVQSLRARLPAMGSCVCIGGGGPDWALDYHALLRSARTQAPRAAVAESDAYTIMYTSGTTGRPKGVVSSHRSRVQVAVQGALDYGMRAEQVTLLPLPLFHMGALNTCFMSHMLSGATVVLMSKFDVAEFLATSQRERASYWFLAPSPIHSIVEWPRLGSFDLSSVRWCMYGGAPMPQEIIRRAAERLPSMRFIQGYGSTEAGQLTVVGPEDHPHRASTCGRPVVLAQVRVVDDACREVAPGEVGEIVTRGPNAMTGYYKADADTAEAFAGGWLHTGDLARREPDGFLTIVERKKDMIISGSENIYPKEVEEVLYAHPSVQDAAVFGIPDEKWGESVCAALVLRPGAVLSEAEVIQWCRSRLAGYKKPRKVVFMDAFPRTSIGKIAKAELREPWWRGSGRRI
ncbi:MAG: long-chain-fatty-acid--CoA ligase [Burkholderiales bacterium]|nr:long-chain-fatty-acid--CoA ligase [Burkholderiales bacterium]